MKNQTHFDVNFGSDNSFAGAQTHCFPTPGLKDTTQWMVDGNMGGEREEHMSAGGVTDSSKSRCHDLHGWRLSLPISRAHH